jgi:hypothetical protein
MWLAMFRSRDFLSRPRHFATDVDTALARLNDPRGLQSMFASYGDVSPYASALADTLTAHSKARANSPAPPRVSVDLSEIAGEKPDPLEWARALGTALDALDDSDVIAAPMTQPSSHVGQLTEIEKLRQLRSIADLGIGDARALLREHGGDLQAASVVIEAGKSPEQRARDKAGAFVAHLVRPHDVRRRPPWQVLIEASGLEYGLPFPSVHLFLQPPPHAESDLRTHTRLLGESATVGAVSWEPNFRWG